MFATGQLRSEIPLAPHWVFLVVVAIRSIGYMMFTYFTMPYFLRFAGVMRIPFLYLILAIYLAFVLVYNLLTFWFYEPYAIINVYLRVFNQCVAAVPINLMVAWYFSDKAAEALFKNPELYPFAKRYEPPALDLIEKLPSEIRSPLIYVKAESPYVSVVTEKGSAMLRMSFHDVLKMLPGDMGWQVHRSIWVSKMEVVDLKFHRGNPKILLRNGTTLSVSRNSVDIVKQYVEKNSQIPYKLH